MWFFFFLFNHSLLGKVTRHPCDSSRTICSPWRRCRILTADNSSRPGPVIQRFTTSALYSTFLRCTAGGGEEPPPRALGVWVGSHKLCRDGDEGCLSGQVVCRPASGSLSWKLASVSVTSWVLCAGLRRHPGTESGRHRTAHPPHYFLSWLWIQPQSGPSSPKGIRQPLWSLIHIKDNDSLASVVLSWAIVVNGGPVRQV